MVSPLKQSADLSASRRWAGAGPRRHLGREDGTETSPVTRRHPRWYPADPTNVKAQWSVKALMRTSMTPVQTCDAPRGHESQGLCARRRREERAIDRRRTGRDRFRRAFQLRRGFAVGAMACWRRGMPRADPRRSRLGSSSRSRRVRRCVRAHRLEIIMLSGECGLHSVNIPVTSGAIFLIQPARQRLLLASNTRSQLEPPHKSRQRLISKVDRRYREETRRIWRRK